MILCRNVFILARFQRGTVKLAITSILLLVACCCTAAQEAEIFRLSDPGIPQKPAGYVPHEYPARPRLALALSGGGARGFAHVGVLKALEEAGIPIDGISGTSIGAVIGGLYAAGYSIQELQALARSLDWSDIFWDAPARNTLPLSSKSAKSDALLELQFSGTKPRIPPALSAGQRLSSLLVDKVNRGIYRGEPDFDQLRVRFRAVSVDVHNGERILFEHGDLSEALLASMALPLFIAPLQLNDHLLIDGGIAENIPVKSARDLGDVVVAVDATMPPRLGPPPYEPWVLANQVTSLMQQELNKRMLAQADFVITPVPDSLSTFSFADISVLVDMGYRATIAQIPDIRKLLAQRSWGQDTSRVLVRNIAIRMLGDAGRVSGFEEQFLSTAAEHAAVAAGCCPERREIYRDLEFLQSDARVQQSWAQISGDTLTFIVQLNPVLKSVSLSGIRQFDSQALCTSLLSDTGQIIDARCSAARLEEILQLYRSHGNPLARIETAALDENGRLQINIDEGIVKTIRTEGQNKIGRRRILRDFRIRVGEPLNQNDLDSGIEELYGSGLFNTVRATCVGGIVTVKVSESPLPRLRLGGGLDSERHGRGFAELSYAAVPAIGGDITGLIKYGEFDERYSFTYRNLAIFQTYLEGAGSLESSHDEYHYYDIDGKSTGRYHFDRLGGTVHIGQQFRTWGRVILGLRAERVRTDYVGSSPEWDLRRVFLRSEIDTQDRTEFPGSGRRYELLLESAAPALQGDISFNRIRFGLKDIQPITRRFAVLTTLDGGICDQATPISEWFRLGGENSFPGLHEAEKAGRQMISLGIELREDLLSRFLAEAYLSLGGHVGAIWQDLNADIAGDDFMTSLGLSFALDTVLGPISITYGHLFSGSQGASRNQFYFNLGHRF